MFRKQWLTFMNDQAIKSVYIAQAFAIFALCLAFTPGYHAISRLSIKSQHRHYCKLALDILEPLTILDIMAPTVEEIQARFLITTYVSITGGVESLWQIAGQVVRMCKALQLYDEDKWDTRDLSDWDIELRRRLAYESCISERWISLHHQRLSDLPAEFRTVRPSYYDSAIYDIDSGKRDPTAILLQMSDAEWEVAKYLMSYGCDRVNRYLYDFQQLNPDQRYQQARQVDDFVTSLITRLPTQIDYEVAFKGGANHSSPSSARNAVQALVCYTSSYRLKCTVMRQFLLDPKSPIDLRIAALEYARKMIETTSNLVAMSSNPWVSFSCAWCSGHLFCAASTFAIVYLGNDKEQELQDLNWFASKTFEVIETFSLLSGIDPVAKRCEELLTALCTSKDWLRERFFASRSGKVAIAQRRKGSSSKYKEPFREDLSDAWKKANVPGFNSVPAETRVGNIRKEESKEKESSQLWNESSLPTTLPLPDKPPNQAMITSPEALSTHQTDVTLN